MDDGTGTESDTIVIRQNLMDAATQAENIAGLLQEAASTLADADAEHRGLPHDVMETLAIVLGGIAQLRDDLRSGWYAAQRREGRK